MNQRIHAVPGMVLGLLVFSGSLLAGELTCDLPNPFLPVAIHTESVGAKWRHSLHHARQTWDKYFEVFPDDLKDVEEVSFAQVRDNAAKYLGAKVQCDVYFGKPGTLFRPYLSPFTSDGYANFSVWEYGAELWSKDARAKVYPFLYVDRQDEDLLAKLDQLPLYAPAHLWIEVVSKSEGVAWMRIHGAKMIKDTPLTDTSLRHVELGVKELGKTHYALAAREFEVALGLELPVAAEASVYAMLGQAYVPQQNYAQARNALVNAVLHNPSDANSLALLARTDIELGRLDEAQQACDRAVTLVPGDPLARAELGLALGLLGDTKGAFEQLDAAQKLAPHGDLPEAHRNRAVVAMHAHDLKLAEEELKKAIQLRADEVRFRLELGDVYLKTDRLAEARREYTQAKELETNRPDAYYELALVDKVEGDQFQKAQKQAAAEKSYKSALANLVTALHKDAAYAPAILLKNEIEGLLAPQKAPAPKPAPVIESREAPAEIPAPKK